MITKLIILTTIVLLVITLIYLYRQNIVLNKKYNNITEYFGDVGSIMNSLRYGNLTVRAEDSSQKEISKLTDSINRMIETLIDREQMIEEYRTELTKKNSFLATILDSLSDGMIVCDENFVIMDSNKKIKEWFNTEKILNTKLENHIKVSEDKEFNILKDDEVFIKGTNDLFFKATTTPLNLQDKKRYLVVISNYTNQKEIESLKEDFVATLTHDLKVPIIAEANMLEFFLNGKFGQLNDTQEDAIKTMSNSNQELLELVQTVLDTYKIKEGEIELHLEETLISKLLNEVKEEMESIAQKNENIIVVNLKPDFRVNIDYLQFKRILKNLVNNAIIYGKKGSNIEINTKQKEGKNYICVKDYGKGIPKSDIDKVFNKYYSAHKKFRKIGTGLGLYLSQKLVQAHNGTLTVTSKEGEWSEFVICI